MMSSVLIMKTNLLRTSKVWLGAAEVATSTWNWTFGGYVSWSLWYEGGQDPSQLGCMVFDGSTKRMREETCDSTNVTGFICKKSGIYVPFI